MNINQIQEIKPTVEVVPAKISADLDTIREQANFVAEYVSSIEVTEDTVKDNKKLIAQVNKMAKSLDSERIAVKKHILSEYTEFESEVKDIVSLIKGADNIVREQIKELEQIERDNKELEIKDIWDKRSKHYDLTEILDFKDFITEQHLNKSVTIKKVEEEMTEFLKSVQNDLNVIKTLPNSKEVLEVYLDTKDLSSAILVVQREHERREKIKQYVEPKKVEVKEEFIFKITGNKDKKLVEMLLKENDIEYEILG